MRGRYRFSIHYSSIIKVSKRKIPQLVPTPVLIIKRGGDCYWDNYCHCNNGISEADFKERLRDKPLASIFLKHR